MPRAVVDLVAELNALAEASADALARLRAGDEAGVIDILERRERLLLLVPEWPHDQRPALLHAARRALALDADMLASLRGWQADVGRRLERLTLARQALESYGGSRPGSALYVERLR